MRSYGYLLPPAASYVAPILPCDSWWWRSKMIPTILAPTKPQCLVISDFRFSVMLLVSLASFAIALGTTACGVSSSRSATTLTKATAPSLGITTKILLAGTMGTPYSASLTASGGTIPYFWGISSGALPSGFVLDGRTGLVSGTTNQSGTFTFQATVSDLQGGIGEASLTVLVVSTAPSATPLTILTQALPTATTGSPYSASLTASGGVIPYFWSIPSGTLPAGFVLNSSSGLLSGTTNQSGTFAFQATVSDSQGGVSEASVSVLVLDNTLAPPLSIPATLFGLIWYYADPYPVIPFGSTRLWDSNDTRWQNLNPSAGTYSFTTLDQDLAEIKSQNGPADVLMTLSSTPTFISSDPTNSNCGYSSTGNGSCGVPTDIAASCTNVNGLNNCDGKTDGTNQAWRSFVYNLGVHIAGLDPGTYQTVTSFDTWNEFTNYDGTTYGSWEGTATQMERLWADANCVLTGRGTGCTAAAMGLTAVGVLPGVKVLTPSAVMTPLTLAGPYGAYLQVSGALNNLDGASIHAYVSGDSPAPAETIATRFNTLEGYMTAAGTSCAMIPCWSTEGSWGQNSISETDPDLQAGFVARYYLVGWSAGFQRLYWYTYAGGTDGSGVGTLWIPNGAAGCSNAAGCLTEAGTAYGVIYNWMVGTAMTGPCAVVSGTTWTCTFLNNTVAVWDTSQTCSSGTCTTSAYTIPAGEYTAYNSLDGSTTPIGAAATTVPIGAKPTLLVP